jgi:hypothetical protein
MLFRDPMNAGTTTPNPQRWVANEPSVVSETVDGETIVIHLETGSYYSLTGMAGTFWKLLQEDGRDAQALNWLRARYAAPDAELKAAWEEFVRSLSGEDLIRAAPAIEAQDSDAAGPGEDDLLPFIAPRIEKFEDMKEMLLLDPIHDVSAGGWPNQA